MLSSEAFSGAFIMTSTSVPHSGAVHEFRELSKGIIDGSSKAGITTIIPV
jgi:hypothetical protein